MYSLISITFIVILAIGLSVMAYLYFKERQKCARYKRGIAVQKSYLQNMSHDIRTPMNAICGFSQLLCNSQIRSMMSEEEIVEYGVIIQSNTDLLSTLVNDILDIIGYGEWEVSFECWYLPCERCLPQCHQHG